MPNIKKKFRDNGIQVTEFFIASWKDGTKKHYHIIISKWESYCVGKQIDNAQCSTWVVLDFWAEQYDRGLGVSGIGTYSSALSDYLPSYLHIYLPGVIISNHPIVV